MWFYQLFLYLPMKESISIILETIEYKMEYQSITMTRKNKIKSLNPRILIILRKYLTKLSILISQTFRYIS